ncbi:MAG: PIN domain-containing protein [Halapricum sp.]
MTFLDTSVIIDYLDDVAHAVTFVDDQDTLRTSAICVYEVLEGEVFGPGQTDIYDTRRAFSRVQSVEFDETIAMEATRLQDDMHADGDALAARDMMIAATARSIGDELVLTDSDFETAVLEDVMSVTNLRA